MKFLLVAALVGLATADRRPPSNGYAAPPSNSYGAPSNSYGEDPLEALAENIPGGGIPGEDYPVLASVPDTGFDCDAQDVPGYYADTDSEAGCQVFHICQDRALRRQKDSFLCPNGTIFNQQYLVCDWWLNFDCETAEDFYSVNELIGVDPNAGYGYGPSNGNSNRNGNGNNGYGNGNGNGKKNGGSKQNGNGNGAYGAPSDVSDIYGPPAGQSNGYDAQSAPSDLYGPPSTPSNGYGAPSNGNGKKNGNRKNGKKNGSRKNGNGAKKNGNGGNNGYGAATAPSDQYGAPSAPSSQYGAPF